MKAADIKKLITSLTSARNSLPFIAGFLIALIISFPAVFLVWENVVESAGEWVIFIFGVICAFLIFIAATVLLRRIIFTEILGITQEELSKALNTSLDALIAVSESDYNKARARISVFSKIAVSWYLYRQTYRWLIAVSISFIAVCASMAGAILLLAQLNRMDIQNQITESQNALIKEQNVVSSLSIRKFIRESLLSERVEANWNGEYQAKVGSIAIGGCRITVVPGKQNLEMGPNSSSIEGILSLYNQKILKKSVEESITALVEDDNPAVALGAKLALARIDKKVDKTFEISGIEAKAIEFPDSFEGVVKFSNSVIGDISCESCSFIFDRSVVFNASANGITSLRSYVSGTGRRNRTIFSHVREMYRSVVIQRLRERDFDEEIERRDMDILDFRDEALYEVHLIRRASDEAEKLFSKMWRNPEGIFAAKINSGAEFSSLDKYWTAKGDHLKLSVEQNFECKLAELGIEELCQESNIMCDSMRKGK